MGSVSSTLTPHLHCPFHLVRRMAPRDVPTRPLKPDRPLHPTHILISLHTIFSPKTRHSPSLRGPACPVARTLIVRTLKGLEDAVLVSVASPELDGSWEFRHRDIPDGDRVVPSLDNANGCKTLREVYRLRRGGYDGRSTVPMLLDVERKEVVCNESYDIIELFNSGLNRLAKNPDLDLSPPSLKKKIEDWNRIKYSNVNNGVYRCRFAQSQQAYDSIVNELFSTLDMQLAIMDGYYNILFPLNPSSIRPVMPSDCEHEFLSQPHNMASLSSYLNENKSLILKIVESQHSGKLRTCADHYLTMLPMYPKLGKMLILGATFNCLDPVLTIVTGLSVRDPFLTPMDKKDEVHPMNCGCMWLLFFLTAYYIEKITLEIDNSIVDF
ncbi:Glutathionyl-hydroquinone reductase YqjG [Camellia lanceoleosa]|uniref:Glutathionyl-hydroquinone reductase YqjG n=1 Tax=Camellia lanceoleosa TaxID=1840588 RepID=A0ACC0FVI0_9ERIC|nr:Glutathionyl-hydroquinone reductase YqjG [Camellia lanceoleosa]